MSGRSSNGSGRGKGRGRGSGRGFCRKKNGSNKPKDDDNKKEMKFTPKIAGKAKAALMRRQKNIFCKRHRKL